MKKKKIVRFMSLLLSVVLLAVSFASCGGNGNGNASESSSEEETNGVSEMTEEITEQITEEATEETTTESTEENTTLIPSDKKYRVLFNEDFNGDEINTRRWEYCPEWDRQDGGSHWTPDMVSVHDGHLELRAEYNPGRNQLMCGAIQTEGKFYQKGGYYEARIKFPTSKGLWGAFWIMAGSVGSVGKGSTDGVEIDIIESIDGDKGKANWALHWDGYGDAHKCESTSRSMPDIYDGEYHIFGFELKNGYYTFYVDGVRVWRSEGGGVCEADKWYMILSLEGTYGRGVGTPESNATLPAIMEVDYVKVYSAKP